MSGELRDRLADLIAEFGWIEYCRIEGKPLSRWADIQEGIRSSRRRNAEPQAGFLAEALATRLELADQDRQRMQAGLDAVNQMIKTACDPDDHGPDNLLARIALPLLDQLRAALTVPEAQTEATP